MDSISEAPCLLRMAANNSIDNKSGQRMKRKSYHFKNIAEIRCCEESKNRTVTVEMFIGGKPTQHGSSDGDLNSWAQGRASTAVFTKLFLGF